MKKVLAILLCIPAMMLQARSYLDLSARVGLSGLTYKTDYGNTIPGYHAAIDVGYLYKSPYWIAFRVGASIEAASSSYRKAGYEDSYSASFPVQLGFHIQHFTFLIGPRFSLPFKGSYKQTASDAALAVYYPKYDNLVEESFPLAASRNFAMENKGDLPLPKWQCSLAGELTYDFLIASQYGKAESFISVGVYFDAGLTSAPTYPDADRHGILYLTDTRDGFPLSRIMTPVLQTWREETPLVAKFGNFAVGFKVAYRLTSAPRQKRTVHGCNCDE